MLFEVPAGDPHYKAEASLRFSTLNLADLMFERVDVKGDDVVKAGQISPQMRAMLLLKGFKVPDKMTREEFGLFFEEMRQQFQRPKPDAKKKPTPLPSPA